MPPSVVLIVYGLLTGQSIGKLFVADIIPAFPVAILFCIAINSYVQLRSEQGPPGDRFPLGTMIFALGELWETVAVFLFLMGGLFFGYFMPRKAGAVGIAAIMLIVQLQRRMDWNNFLLAVLGTIKTSRMVLMLIAGGTIFGHFLALSRIPLEVGEAVANMPWPGWAIMAMICLIYLVGGCFIDSLAPIMLTIPIFYPTVVTLGYDPIWSGIIIVMVGRMGIITPPVGINAFIVKGIVPFLIVLILGTAVMIAFPPLVTWLPDLMY